MLVLSILIIMITQFAWSSKVERTVARNARDDLKMQFAARGSVSVLRAYLRADRAKQQPLDSLREDWADPAKYQSIHMGPSGSSGVNMTIAVKDCESLLNVNLLAGDTASRDFAAGVLRRLAVDRLQIPDGAELVEHIVDYVDQDTTGQFESGARNAPLFHPDELLDMPGLTPDQIQALIGTPDDPQTGTVAKRGLLEFLTAFGSKKMNINTVESDLLWALLPEQDTAGATVDRDAVLTAIEEFRTGPASSTSSTTTTPPPAPTTGGSAEDKPGTDFKKVDELGSIPGLSPRIFQAAAPTPSSPSPSSPPPTTPGPPPVQKGIPRKFLTVEAEDFRMMIDASCNGLTNKRYEVILKRGKEEFNVLLWREVMK